MKRLFLGFALIPVAFYLYTMNSTENRQRLTEETIGYSSFKYNYLNKFGSGADQEILRCYSVYNSLLDFNRTQDCAKEDVKDKLIAMGLCELEEGHLVLKGFFLEDSLRKLTVGKPRIAR